MQYPYGNYKLTSILKNYIFTLTYVGLYEVINENRLFIETQLLYKSIEEHGVMIGEYKF